MQIAQAEVKRVAKGVVVYIDTIVFPVILFPDPPRRSLGSHRFHRRQ